jgi:hypothetical protein
MFLWRQPGPGGQMAARFKRSWIDLDRERQRGERSHAGNRGQTLADLVGFMRGGQFGIEFLYPGVEMLDLLAQQDGPLLSGSLRTNRLEVADP